MGFLNSKKDYYKDLYLVERTKYINNDFSVVSKYIDDWFNLNLLKFLIDGQRKVVNEIKILKDYEVKITIDYFNNFNVFLFVNESHRLHYTNPLREEKDVFYTGSLVEVILINKQKEMLHKRKEVLIYSDDVYKDTEKMIREILYKLIEVDDGIEFINPHNTRWETLKLNEKLINSIELYVEEKPQEENEVKRMKKLRRKK